jgi:hypothetical protein
MLRILSKAASPVIVTEPPKELGDVARIQALPKVTPYTLEEAQQVARTLKARLGNGATQCQCRVRGRPCCADLLPTQAIMLAEGEKARGLFAAVGPGHGKTLPDLLMPMMFGTGVWVLLVKHALKHQLISVDIPYYAEHWKLPNIAGGKWMFPGRPILHVVTYESLSSKKNMAVLESLGEVNIILDEGQAIANRKSSRAIRFNAYTKAHPKSMIFFWSGTPMDRSFTEWGSLCGKALKQTAPVPLHYTVIDEFAKHLDPGGDPDPGLLQPFVKPGDTSARVGYFERVHATAGVVSSGDAASCQAALTIAERVLKAPKHVLGLMDGVNAGERPDKDTLIDQKEVIQCNRQLALGFYYRWIWPHMEPVPVIEAWLAARKVWRQALRKKLSRPKPGMDSPLLLEEACRRWEEGYVFIDPATGKRKIIQPRSAGPRQVWNSEEYREWARLRNTAKPETETVWVDHWAVNDTIAFLTEAPGRLVWYEYTAFAKEVKRREPHLLHAGPGEEGNHLVGRLRGNERVLLSMSHATGKNLQMFHEALVTSPASSNRVWEQLLARMHRPGQSSDEVTYWTYRHTPEYRNALEEANERAEYAHGTWGTPQRLTHKATYLFDT